MGIAVLVEYQRASEYLGTVSMTHDDNNHHGPPIPRDLFLVPVENLPYA